MKESGREREKKKKEEREGSGIEKNECKMRRKKGKRGVDREAGDRRGRGTREKEKRGNRTETQENGRIQKINTGKREKVLWRGSAARGRESKRRDVRMKLENDQALKTRAAIRADTSMTDLTPLIRADMTLEGGEGG